MGMTTDSPDQPDPVFTALKTTVFGALTEWWRKDGTEMDDIDLEQCKDAALHVASTLHPLLRPPVLQIPDEQDPPALRTDLYFTCLPDTCTHLPRHTPHSQ